MIDPTKLLRAGFVAASTGWVLANLDAGDAQAVFGVIRAQSFERTAVVARRQMVAGAAASIARFHLWHERTLLDSMSRFFEPPVEVRNRADQLVAQLEGLVGDGGARVQPSGEGALVFSRQPEPKGPLSVFGYDYLADKYGADRAAKLQINSVRALWGDGSYAYEVLNLVDGRRTVLEIADMVSAIYGPVPLPAVLEYLRALEEIGMLRERGTQ
jgi:hypothetical protein